MHKLKYTYVRIMCSNATILGAARYTIYFCCFVVGCKCEANNIHEGVCVYIICKIYCS